MNTVLMTTKELIEAEETLWREVLERLSHLPAREALVELNGLLDNVRQAGGGSQMFVEFASAWLETARR